MGKLLNCVCEIIYIYMCTSFLHTTQLFKKSSCLNLLKVSTATTEITLPLCSNPTNGSWFNSESKSLWPTRSYVISIPPLPLASLTHWDCLLPLSSLAIVFSLSSVTGKPSPSGCYLWLPHSFPRYPHGATSYILQFFAHISLFSEDSLAHCIKMTTFVSSNLLPCSNFFP